jgi:hypothetical protein
LIEQVQKVKDPKQEEDLENVSPMMAIQKKTSLAGEHLGKE